ncbi:MAG: hypothetical protein HUU35_04100, partial [Armatimonadetes bacterium]|nr:hypothetical protein [Armatimonadota bacterium]
IDAVELAFLRRTARPRGLAAAEARVELESLNRLLTWLGPARLATRQRAWMGAYQDRLATWSEHLLEPAASR